MTAADHFRGLFREGAIEQRNLAPIPWILGDWPFSRTATRPAGFSLRHTAAGLLRLFTTKSRSPS